MTTLEPDVLDFYDSEVVKLIMEKYGYGEREALPAFLCSKTYAMLSNPEMGMCQFGPPAIFDMWECEKVTGNPRLSAYLRME